MTSVKYLERRTTSTLELIKCAGEELISISIELPKQSRLDFLKVISIQNIEKINGFQTSQLSRPYLKTREKDIFNLIESGYKVVNERIFIFLCDLRQTQLN